MFWPYQGAGDECTGRAQTGTKNLMVAINDQWVDSTSLGIYNCRPVRGGTTPSIHSEGRAVDIGFPVLGGVANPLGTRLLNVLKENAEPLGLQAIIWNRRYYSRSYPTGRVYNGVNPHIDHLHIEQTWAGSQSLTLNQSYLYTGEKMLTPEQEAVLNELVLVRRELTKVSSNFFAIPAAVKLIKALRQVDDVFDVNEF